MPKRLKDDNDLVDRLQVVGSVALSGLCGLGLIMLLLWGPYGWILSLIGLVLWIAAFLFWPRITSLFWSIFRHKPKRAIDGE